MPSADDLALPDRKITDKDLEYVRLAGRRQIWFKVVDGFSLALAIASFALPLWVSAEIAKAFAGKETNVNVDVKVAIGIAVSLSGFSALVTWLVNRRKMKEQGEELARLRGRQELLEHDRTRLSQENAQLREGKPKK